MNIDNSLLIKLEKLSSLEIESEKREGIISQLSEIVSFVENLNELDLLGYETSFATIEGGTPFREDTPIYDENTIKTVIKYAPNSENGFFIVPKIIE